MKPVERTSQTPNTHDKADPLDTVYLVSCVSKKRPARVPEKDLYLSDWFIRAGHSSRPATYNVIGNLAIARLDFADESAGAHYGGPALPGAIRDLNLNI